MEENNEISWVHLPLYSSLTEHVLLAGAPKSVLGINIIITVLFLINFNFWYILFLTVPLQFFCIYLSQNDAQFFDCYSIYVGKDDYYST
jgi:type IV secretion system protein TrbD